ncbi:MAG TPA: hypothetical protein VG435_08755 [Acidimicrobiales bacterium]|nr:hypothetical protein [Acidimicrobiales bacterium]
MDEMAEEKLAAGEQRSTDHDHDGVEVTENSLSDHLTGEHGMEIPDGLSAGALRGIHDRFHGEAHASEE